MTLRRKQQIWYVLADLLSSELVWLCFLGFRWMVYEGHVGLLDGVLVPAFSFRLPLIIYPLVCLLIYYLSGYYLRPFQKPLWREFLQPLSGFIRRAVWAAVHAQLHPASDHYLALASSRHHADKGRPLAG